MWYYLTWKRCTCIFCYSRFVKRKTQKDYIRIDEGVGCSSGIGMWGIGKQNVTLGPLCNSMGTILHELMHVIG